MCVVTTVCAMSVTNSSTSTTTSTRWELYDLKTDPTEMHNLYGRPGMEKVTREMKKELLRLQVQYDDSIRHSQKL